MKRREFITLLGGTAAAWPLAAGAQQDGRVRRVGGLRSSAEDDLQGTQAAAVVREGLQKLGWIEGRNIRIDYRFAAGSELVGLGPDVLIAHGAAALAPLQRATRTIPIVFGNVTDPVANGFVTSIPRPGGNITGFSSYEQSISVKWLELLKEIAPHVTRAAFLHDPLNPITPGYWREVERGAPAFRVQVSAAPMTSAAEIERAIADAAREPNRQQGVGRYSGGSTPPAGGLHLSQPCRRRRARILRN
jgi:putative ABC transport system substrate-binding protein